MGKSFEYWKNLYDQGIFDKHVIYLRLVHLKYAVDQNLITNDEYCAHRLRITEKFSPSSTEYKTNTLMDFGKSLSMQNFVNEPEINQPLETDHCIEKIYEEQKGIMNSFEKATQQNETIVNLNEYYDNLDKKQKHNQTKITKKSKRKRKKKKKKNSNSEIKDNVQDNTQIGNSTKQVVTSKDPVKIFVRQVNKQNLSTKKVNQGSTKRSIREIFSKILKQFKEENQ